MLKHIIALAFVVKLIFSICPNDCNGNGQCTKEGVCICHKQGLKEMVTGVSIVPGYTGADCSERTCPLGNPFASPTSPNNLILQTTSTTAQPDARILYVEEVESKPIIQKDVAKPVIQRDVKRSVIRQVNRNTTRGLVVTDVKFKDGASQITAYKIDSGDFTNINVFSSLECKAVKCKATCKDGGSSNIDVIIWGYTSSYVLIQIDGVNTVDTSFIKSITACNNPTVEINDFSDLGIIDIDDQSNPVTKTLNKYGELFTVMGYTTTTATIDLWCYHTDLSSVDGKIFTQSSSVKMTVNGDNLDFAITPSPGSTLVKGDICYLMARPDGSGGIGTFTPKSASNDPFTGCAVCDKFKLESSGSSDIWYKIGMTCTVSSYTMTIESELSELIATAIKNSNKFNVPNHCTESNSGDSTKMLKNLHKGTELAIKYGTNTVISPSFKLKSASESGTPSVYTITYENQISITTTDNTHQLVLTLTPLETITPITIDGSTFYKVKRDYKVGRMGGKLACSGSEAYGVTEIHVRGYDGSEYSYISFDSSKLNKALCLKPYSDGTGGSDECDPNSVYPSDIECGTIKTKYNDLTNYNGVITLGANPTTFTWTNYGQLFTDMKFIPATPSGIKVWCYHTDLSSVDGKIFTQSSSVKMTVNGDNLDFTITPSSGSTLVKGDICYLMAKVASGNIESFKPSVASNDPAVDGCDVCGEFTLTSNVFYKTGMTCEVVEDSPSPSLTYVMTIKPELSEILAKGISGKTSFNVPNHCIDSVSGNVDTKMLKNLHKGTELAITYGSNTVISPSFKLKSASESATPSVYTVEYSSSITISSSNTDQQLVLTLTPLEAITPLTNGNEVLYKVKRDYEVGRMGGIFTCDLTTVSAAVSLGIKEIHVRGYDGSEYSYISFDKDIQSNLCLKPYTGVSGATGECNPNSVYPSDIDYDSSSATKYNDFTKYNGVITLGSTPTTHAWTNYGKVFTDMKFITASTNIDLWCYHTKLDKVDGKLHQYDLTKIEASGNDVEFTITPPSGSTLEEGDKCYLMAKVDDGSNTITPLSLTPPSDGTAATGCDVCGDLTAYNSDWYKIGMTCEVTTTSPSLTYVMTIKPELSALLAKGISNQKSFNVPNHCTGSDKNEEKMLKNLHKGTNLTITYDGTTVSPTPDTLKSAKETTSSTPSVYTVDYQDNKKISVINNIDEKKVLVLTLSPLVEVTKLTNGNEVLYKVKRNYGLGRIGGVLVCDSKTVGNVGASEIHVRGYDGSEYSYISFDESAVISNLCLKPYSDGSGSDECDPNSVYPLDIDYDSSSATKYNDFTKYNGVITLGSTPTTFTWTNYGTVFTDMKFVIPTSPASDIKVWCYHNKTNIDGIIYVNDVTLATSSGSNGGNDITLSITQGTGQSDLLEGDVCYLMAKLDASANIISYTPTNAIVDGNTGCDVCNEFVIKTERQIWLKKPDDLSCKVLQIDSGKKYNITLGSTLTRFIINHYIDSGELKIPITCNSLNLFNYIRKSANITIEINGYESSKFTDKDEHMIYTVKKEGGNITITFRNYIDFNTVNFRKLADIDTEGNTKMIMSIILTPAPKIEIITSNNNLKIYKVPHNYGFQLDGSIIGRNFSFISYKHEDGKKDIIKYGEGRFWGFNTSKQYSYLSFDNKDICADPYANGCKEYYPLDFNYTFNSSSEIKDLSNYRWNVYEKNHTIELKGFSEIFESIGFFTQSQQSHSSIPLACYHPFENIDSLLYQYKSTIEIDKEDVVIRINQDANGKTDNLTTNDICFIIAKKDGTKIDIENNKPTTTSDNPISPSTTTVCDQCANFYYNGTRLQWYYGNPGSSMQCTITETQTGSGNNIYDKKYTVDIGASLTRLIINKYLLKTGSGTYSNSSAEVGKLEIPKHCTNPLDLFTMIRKSANISIELSGYGSSQYKDKIPHIIWYYKDETDFHYVTLIEEFALNNVSYDKMKGLGLTNGVSLTMKIIVTPAPKIEYIQYNYYRIYKIPRFYDFSYRNNIIRSNLTVDSVNSANTAQTDFQDLKAYFWGYNTSSVITYISFESYKDESKDLADDKICLDPYYCANGQHYPLDFNYTVDKASERKDFTDYKYINLTADNLKTPIPGKTTTTLNGYGTIFRSIGFFGSSAATTKRENIPIRFYHPFKNIESILYNYTSTIEASKNAKEEDLVITITHDKYPNNNHLAVDDVIFIMADRNGKAIDIINSNKPNSGEDFKLVNSNTKVCDQCVNFYYNKNRDQWFFHNPSNFTLPDHNDPGMKCTVTPIGKGITDNTKYVYNITVDSTYARLIINHYLNNEELEIPYKNCDFIKNSSLTNPNEPIEDMVKMVRKSASVKLEISGYKETEFEDKDSHMIYDVRNDLVYNQEIIIVKLREKLLFEKVRFRLLEIMSDPNKLKMSIIVTPAPSLIPIYSNNELKVYRVPLNYSINIDTNNYIIKVNLTCTSNTTDKSNGKNINTTKTLDAIYWGYRNNIDIHNVISYISYNETLCDDPYGVNNEKLSACMNKYAYDFDCKRKDNDSRVDLTDYKLIKLSALNVTNKEFNWLGFGEILVDNGWNKGDTVTGFKFKCYHSDKTDDYYSNLTYYEATVTVNKPDEKTPNVINYTPANVTMKIDDKLNPNTLQENDICFLLSTRKGEIIELKTDNPVTPTAPNGLKDCDACNVFYYDTIRKEYYIKVIYLNRIQSNYTEFPQGVYTNNTIIFSFGKIQDVLTEYFNHSYYHLLKPTNKSSIPELRKVIKPTNIIELALSRPDPNDLTVRKVYYKEITQILSVEEINGMFNISTYPPFLPLQDKFNEVKNIKEEPYSNQEAIIFTHVILPNSDCNDKTKICKHYLLNLNLPIEGGNVVVSKNNTVIGSGNVLSYKSTYPQVCYIQYKFNDAQYDGENFYKSFNYTLYDYKISSTRNDLSLYTESTVKVVNINNNDVKVIEWKDYGKSIELMGLLNKEVSMLCYTPGSEDKITAAKYKAEITLFEEDIRFIFSGATPDVGDTCFLTVNGKGEDMTVKEIEASTFFEEEEGVVHYVNIKEDEVIVTTTTTTTITEETNKTITNTVIKAGSSIYNQMKNIYNTPDDDDDEEEEDPTASPTPSINPINISPNFAVPLPNNDKKELVTSKIEIDKWMKVQIYLGAVKALESTVKITRVVRTVDQFVIVKISPSINLDLEDRLRTRRSRRRILQSGKTPIIIITLDIASPVIGTDQVQIPYNEDLHFNKEGGLLSCTNLNNGEKGLVDITSYNKYNDNNMMYAKFDFKVSTDSDVLSCQIAFKRTDLSLYTSSIVEKITEKNERSGVEDHYFMIKWKGYSAAYQQLIAPNILPKNDLQKLKLLCFHPDGGGENKNDYKLRQFNTRIGSIDSDLKIVFYENDGKTKITRDRADATSNSDKTLTVGDICYPMNYIEAGETNGKTISIKTREESELDAAKYFQYIIPDGEDSGDWYYKVVNETTSAQSSITSEGPQVMYSEEKSKIVLETYSESKEILLIISNDEAGGIFKMKISNGMIIEIYIKGVDKNNNGYENKFIGQIASIRSGENDNELLIKTIEDFDDFPTIKEPRERMLTAAEINNVVVAITLRENLIGDSLIECSGNGLCNRETGKCNCYDGFTGVACQRIDCPNNCNGNGRCVPLTELLSNTDLKGYEGFGTEDKIYGCLCDEGYRGYDCSLIECPSDKDYMEATNVDDDDEQRDCSGRGICDYKTGSCTCFEGYSGEGCQYYQILG